LLNSVNDKFFARSQEILSFLDPLDITELSTFEQLPEVIRCFPAHTLLTRDFFEEMLSSHQIRGAIGGEGNWVQVGVWKGGGALFFRALMEDYGIDSELHLYDTFDGCRSEALTQPEDRRFSDALGLQHVSECYEESAVSLLERFSLNSKVVFHKGDITNPNDTIVPDKISLLHLDVDFYEPTLSALRLFYDRVVPGGTIIVDDYYLNLVNCRQAVDNFVLEKDIAEFIDMNRFSSFSLIMKKRQ